MTGGLGFVVLSVHSGGNYRKLDRTFLPQRRYRLKLSAYLYNKYLVRYGLSDIFDGFLSCSCHPPSRAGNRWERNGQMVRDLVTDV